LDLDAVWDGDWVGRGMGVLDGGPHPQRDGEVFRLVDARLFV